MKLTPSIQQMIDDAPAPIDLRHFMRRLLEWMNNSPFGKAATQVMSTVLEASRVLKAGPGQLHSLSVFNSKSSAQFILIIDSATVPANGAVTLLYPPIPIAAGTLVVLDFPRALVASTGIAVCNSSTGTFTKTIGSADCVFYSRVTN